MPQFLRSRTSLLVQSEPLDLLLERSSDIGSMPSRLSPVRISALAWRPRDSEWFGHGLPVIFGDVSPDPRGSLAGVLTLAAILLSILAESRHFVGTCYDLGNRIGDCCYFGPERGPWGRAARTARSRAERGFRKGQVLCPSLVSKSCARGERHWCA
jgi:hypothetical protein